MSKYINQYSNYAAYSGDSSNFNYPHAAYLNEEGIGVYDRNPSRFYNICGTLTGNTNSLQIRIGSGYRNVTIKDDYFMYNLTQNDNLNGSLEYMFGYLNGTRPEFKSIDKVGVDFSNITSMRSMFSGLNNVSYINLSNFNTSACRNMQSMFRDCKSLTSLDLSNFNTSACTNMNEIFNGCSGLASLDVNNFNTSACTNMTGMFFNCKSLTSLDVSNFNTSNVTSMGVMFSDCTSLITIDISNWDTTKAAGHPSYYIRMFNNCSSLGSITMNNTSQSTLEFIEARLVNDGIASNVTIHRDGYAWTYSGGQWSSTPE